MDNKEFDEVEDIFGDNVEENYDVPVYEPIMDNTNETINVEELPKVEPIDIDSNNEVVNNTVPFEENTNVEVPVYESTVNNPNETINVEELPKVEPIDNDLNNEDVNNTVPFEENTNVEASTTDNVESIAEESAPVYMDTNVSNESQTMEDINTVAPVALEPSYEEDAPVPFAEEELSNNSEHPDAIVTLQRTQEVKEETTNEDLKVNLMDNTSLKFVLIIGIIIFIAIMVLPFTNLI